MNEFARIFSIENEEGNAEQVLVFWEYDGDQDETVLHVKCELDGVRGSVGLVFKGETQHDVAIKAFKNADRRFAESMREKIKGVLFPETEDEG